MSELVERLEPMVPRNRRLALHNLHRLSQSLFYAQNLMAQIERELGLLEKEKEIETPVVDESKFSLRTSTQLTRMFHRLAALEEAAGIDKKEDTESKATSATVAAEEPIEDTGLTNGAAAV